MEQFDKAREQWEEDDANSRTLVRYQEHFKAKTQRQTYINQAAFVVGTAASCLVTKQRPHNLAFGALSYIAAMNIQNYADQHLASTENGKDELFVLTSKEL